MFDCIYMGCQICLNIWTSSEHESWHNFVILCLVDFECMCHEYVGGGSNPRNPPPGSVVKLNIISDNVHMC